MRFGMRASPDLGAQLERAVSGAPVAVGGGGGFGGLRVSGLLRQRILRCLGQRMRIEHTESLFAMKHGQRVELGCCEVDGKRTRFDIWVPHEGIAIDYHPREMLEVQTKAEWCANRQLLYIAVHTIDDAICDQMQALINERRESLYG